MLELQLNRTYLPEGTNGALFMNGVLVCFTIELPWRNNEHGISCIPEGRYALINRNSKTLGEHLKVLDVPNRDEILIHAANIALLELKGCIAPETKLIGAGRGLASKIALKKLITLIGKITETEPVYLLISEAKQRPLQ